jgi:hypothetical protein
MPRSRKTSNVQGKSKRKPKKVQATSKKASNNGQAPTKRRRTGTKIYNFDDFHLHPCNFQMKSADITSYTFLAFDEPERGRYFRTDGTAFTRLRIPIYSRNEGTSTRPLGYLPLPTKYLPHWKQLCYTIVYHQSMYQAQDGLDPKEWPSAQLYSRSVGAILKYYLYCRGKIIEEIFSMKGREFGMLPTFDEFIIKERWDLHWVALADLPKMEQAEHLGSDPFSTETVAALSK